MNYIFYDTETTGIKRSHDQIIQFGAVLTDDGLNEIDSFELRCRLLPDIAPSIGAIRANRVSVHQLVDPSLPSHYQMVRQIREKLLSWCPAVFVGYNSVAFDEHLLRQAFYRTLHPLYLTNTSGNSRFDAMKLVQAASVFAPDAIVIPVWETGERTFRLDRVAPANDIEHESAHDAMADVRATRGLCRLLHDSVPELWSRAIRLARKPSILDFVATERVCCLTEFYYARAYCWIVSSIGHGPKSNDVYLYNLAVDPMSLLGVSDWGLRSRLAKRPKPVRRIRANAVPILSRLDDAPNSAEGLPLGRDRLAHRANMLRENPDLRERLIAAFEANRDTRQPSPHVEEQIYDGFFSAGDEGLMASFHSASWEDRPGIVDQFDDARLRELGYRLIYCERADVLNEAAFRAESTRIARKLLGLERGVLPWLTLREAIQEANDRIEMAGSDRSHLIEHRNFLQTRLAEAMRVIG